MIELGDKIRAMKRGTWGDTCHFLDRAAALADEHEAEADALVAAAYEDAADACADYPRVAPDATEAQHYDEQIDHSQACILACTPAEARAALDRLIREAEARGMEMGAAKATSFLIGNPHNGIPLRNPMAHEIATAIRAMTDADARAALDRIKAEARREGMREAAGICERIRIAIANGPMPEGARFDYEQAILAAAENGDQ